MEEAWLALIRGERRGPFAMLARFGLRLASWPYAVGSRTRNALFDRGWRTIHTAAVPVVSVVTSVQSVAPAFLYRRI